MNRKPRAAVWPFYLKLYDDIQPATRAGFDAFLADIRRGLEGRGLAVSLAPVCRVASEFEAAAAQLEAAGADCLVTVHLAYSPSLEAIDACCRTSLPLLLLDTTMDAAFGPGTDPGRIMFNHGVHGVMDLASLLRRRRRPFEIVAGPLANPRTLDRAAALVRTAAMARDFRSTRAARIGPAFAGMGDFAAPESVLADRLGIRVTQLEAAAVGAAAAAVTPAQAAAELEADRARFDCEAEAVVHERSIRVGLGLRHVLDEGGFTAFSANFQAFGAEAGPAAAMPFLEIAKAMGRGLGYAGEGDVLTAALVGALARGFGAATFTEIFCPDWAGNSLFLSHMGEISPSVAGARPRIITKRPFPFGPQPPAVLVCPVRAGPAVFVNLAPGPDDHFTLIVAPVDVLPDDGAGPLRDTVRAWIRPRGAVSGFLEAYSRLGGTHHSALVLGEAAEAVSAFGRFAGLDPVVLE